MVQLCHGDLQMRGGAFQGLLALVMVTVESGLCLLAQGGEQGVLLFGAPLEITTGVQMLQVIPMVVFGHGLNRAAAGNP